MLMTLRRIWYKSAAKRNSFTTDFGEILIFFKLQILGVATPRGIPRLKETLFLIEKAN